MLKSVHYYTPVAVLVALVIAMAFVPKIGPVVLVVATIVAALPFVETLWLRGPGQAIVTLREAIGQCSTAKHPVLVILVFMSLCVISLLWVPDPGFALSRTLKLLGFFALVTVYGLIFMHLNRQGRSQIQPLARLATVGFILAAICLAFSFAFVVPEKPSPDAFINRSVVVLALSGFAVTAYIWSSSWSLGIKGALTGCLTAAILILSLSSGSQTSTVAFLGGIGAMIVFKLAVPTVRRLLVLAIAALCFVMPLLVMATSALPQSILTSGFFQRGSAGHRIRIWDSYMALVREKPFFGWGTEASRDFDPALLSIPVEELRNAAFTSHPHNAFLQLWTDLGMVGALLFCILIALLGLRIENARAEARAPIYGLFAGILVTSAVSHGAFQSWWLASIALLAVSVFPLAMPVSGAARG